MVFYSKGRVFKLYKFRYLIYQWWVSIVKVITVDHLVTSEISEP